MFQPTFKNNQNHLNPPETSSNTNFGCIRLANRFRFLNLVSEIEGLQIYFGFEIETKKEVLIVCHQVFKRLFEIAIGQKKEKSPKNESYFHQPLWVGYQAIQGINYRFHVYEKRGCSIEDYFGELSEIKPIHIHFLLKIFVVLKEIEVKLIRIMEIQKINSDSMNLKTVFLYPKPGNAQSVFIDLFTFENLIGHKKSIKENGFNLKDQKPSSNFCEIEKKVSFSEDPVCQKPQYLTLEELVLKFYQILIKSTLPNSASRQLENEESFPVLLSFLKKFDKNNRYLPYSSSEFIERFLEIQSTLLRQKLIDKKFNTFLEIELEASKISYSLMRKSESHIEEMDKVFKAEESQLLSEIYQENGDINLKDFFSKEEMEEREINDTALSEILVTHSQVPTKVFKNNLIKHHKSEIFQKSLLHGILQRYSSQADYVDENRGLENIGY